MRCDIIIPVWDQLEATRRCIVSIRENTDYPYRLIIIDNASGEETRNYLHTLADILLIRNEENAGFVKAVNQGLRASNASYMCIMNNDTIATAGWLKEMIDVVESNPGIGIVNPSSNTSGQTAPEHMKGQIQELYNCRGFCMLLKREVIEKTGLFDEIYSPGYFEETDYSKRAHENGFMIARAKGAYVYHSEGASFKNLNERQALFQRNERIFFRRWGRPIRVAYLVDEKTPVEKVEGIAAAAARRGDQILIFLKKGLDWPIAIDHFEIRRVDIGRLFFNFIALCKILKRKEKKKIDVILTDDKAFGNFLASIKNMHKADVVVNPF